MEKNYKIKSNDGLVHDVIRKFDERSAVGFAKYGSTLRGDNDTIHRWLNDVQEELMDAILYLQKVKEEASTLLEERLLKEYIDEIEVEANPISAYPQSTMTMASGDIKVTMDQLNYMYDKTE